MRLVSSLVCILALMGLRDTTADSYVDERQERLIDFASRSVASFITYRVLTGNKEFDPLIKEYLKVLCGRNSSLPVGARFNARIDDTDLEKLFAFSQWSGALVVGCGCFISHDTDGFQACGDAWIQQGIWRVH